MTPCYTGPVIDPHHHLWDTQVGQYPWLAAMKLDSAPYKGSPENRLGRWPARYDVSGYLADVAGHDVVGTVHVEAGRSAEDAPGETAWLDTLGHNGGVAQRYVVNVALDNAEAPRLLDGHCRNERVTGVRDILSWHPDPARSFARTPDRMLSPSWQAGLASCRERNLHFEAMLFPWQISDLCTVIDTFGDVRFVINHCASPIDRNVEGLALWRKGLAALAARPNVDLKISNPVAYDPD